MKSNGMDRTRGVFVLIIAAAVIIVLVSVVINAVGNNSGAGTDPGGGGQAAQPTEPPAGSVVVIVQSANTKEDWLDIMEERFNALNKTTEDGQRVIVEVKHTGSPMLPEHEPVMWSPANQSWVDDLNQDWMDTEGHEIISDACPGTVSIPIGIAMWRPMAEALGWPDADITWGDIVELALDPDGWASYGHPEWGVFRYGHGHPTFSNSGRLSIVAEIYAAGIEAGSLSASDALTVDNVWDQEAMDAVEAVQQATFHYGERDTFLLDKMVRRGPDYLHAVTNYEGNVVRWNALYGPEGTGELRFPLVLIYPKDGTFWMDHPMCVLDRADWVSEAEIEGAEMFRDFILEKEQQEAVVETGLRPALEEGIQLTEPLSIENGVNPNVNKKNVPVLPLPSDEVIDNVIDMWLQVKKPAVVVMVIDVSGSMRGQPMQSAAKGAQEFLNFMNANDEIITIVFNDQVTPLEPSGVVGEVREELRRRVGGLVAGGGTALHKVTVDAFTLIEEIREADIAAGTRRTYSIVLMTDGRNEANDGVAESYMLSVLPEGTESDEVHIYTIAYGDNANDDLLNRIANRTNGHFYQASTENIEEIYFQISSEF